LKEILRRRALEKGFWEIESYLYSQELCFRALFLEIDLKHNDLFGNLLKKGTFVWRNFAKATGEDSIEGESPRRKAFVPDKIHLTLKTPGKSKRKIRRRGYNDHGSLPPKDSSIRKKEFLKDFSRDLEQEAIELRRTKFSLSAQNRILELLSEIGLE